LYYLITPVFILLDYCGGINVRVAVLDDMPVYKNLYYGFCVLCGVVVYLLPQWSAVVALFESPVNLVITILGVILPYVERIKQSDDILTTGWKPTLGLSTEYVTNLLLAAGIATFAFLQANKTLSDRFEAATRPQRQRLRSE